MTKEEWVKIVQAKNLLGLGDFASLQEIKNAYRKMCKKHHPDTVQYSDADYEVKMHEITDAYQLLTEYCKTYRFPLTPGGKEELDAEEWWLDRFGQDPLWGKG